MSALALIPAVFNLFSRGAEAIARFRKAKDDDERKASLDEAYDTYAEVRKLGVQLAESQKLTPAEFNEAMAEIAQGEADYLTEFDNTKKED